LHIGFSNLVFDYNTVIKIANGYFKGSCLTAVGKSEWDAMRWTGSAGTKKDVINKANFTFTSLEKASDYDKHVSSLNSQNVRSFLLDCSDSHNFSDSSVKDRIGNSFCWLKADTTFEGLKQIANDKSRIFIGEKPKLLDRVIQNRTKYINILKLNKLATSSLSEKWFSNLEITLNSSLVAFIGNKGNGKSALADTIGLIGNTRNYNDFSFLNKEKFRRPKPINKSEHFEGSLIWEDGNIDTIRLSQNPSPQSIEKVKYIPQGFLETLCNEDTDAFENELREVIFSHLSESEKLGKQDLTTLIDFKTEIINKEIENLKKEVNQINKIIVDLENKQSEDYSKYLPQN
jgi:hypothetical protein